MAATRLAVALTIAGSDSGGGAGIQADLVTFAALGVHGASVVTALTAQNTVGVTGVHVPPLEFLQAQLGAVLDDLPVAAVKTGMLATGRRWSGGRRAGGRRACPTSSSIPSWCRRPVPACSIRAESAYLEALFPHALVVTPNAREASALLSTPVETSTTPAGRRRAGGVGAAVGGGQGRAPRWRSPGEGACARRSWSRGATGEVTELCRPRVATRNDHGTGCTLRRGGHGAARPGHRDARSPSASAKRFVHEGLVSLRRLGARRRPRPGGQARRLDERSAARRGRPLGRSAAACRPQPTPTTGRPPRQRGPRQPSRPGVSCRAVRTSGTGPTGWRPAGSWPRSTARPAGAPPRRSSRPGRQHVAVDLRVRARPCRRP